MPSALGVSLALALAATSPDTPAEPSSSAPGASVTRTLAVIPVDGPGSAPPAELAEAAHALRVSLRERAVGVFGPAELRTRIGAIEPSLVELERTYAGALAAFQADELDGAARILAAVIAELEQQPESPIAHDLWVRAHLRLAQAERSRSRPDEAARAMERILALDPTYVVDVDQFAPSFRRAFEEARARVELARRCVLTIRSRGRPVVASLDGKELGPTPVTVEVPPGQYRARGALPGAVGAATRTPAVVFVAAAGPLEIELDAPLAEAVHLGPVPFLAVPAGMRGSSVVALGAWLRADEVVAVERSLDDGPGVSASLYDVRRGTLVREASAPVVSGTLRPESVDALASFLLTGERAVPRIDLTAAVDPPPKPARWLRPATYAAGVAALALGAFALLEVRSSHDSTTAAAAMVRADGALVPGAERVRYDEAVRGADAAMRNAYVAGAGAVAIALTAAILGYRSIETRPGPVFAPAVRF
jgi:hypothetical protein